jgi:hypothetical protein
VKRIIVTGLLHVKICNKIRDVISRGVRARTTEEGGASELSWLSMEQGASRPHGDLSCTLSNEVMVINMHIRFPDGRKLQVTRHPTGK